MKKLFFLGACLVALASVPARAQTGGADIIVARVYEGNGGQIVVNRGGNKTEVIEFNPNYSTKALTESSGQLQQLVATLYQQGYVLKSTFSGNGAHTATLIFVKEK